MSDPLIDSNDEVCASLMERGLHVFDVDALEWEVPRPRPGSPPRPAGEHAHADAPREKWLVFPEPDSDRFPIVIVRFPPNYVFPRHWHTEGEFVMVLKGSMRVGDRELGSGGTAYNDAFTIYGAEAAGPEGCEFLLIRRAFAKTTMASER
jgi:hypothetical protein